MRTMDGRLRTLEAQQLPPQRLRIVWPTEDPASPVGVAHDAPEAGDRVIRVVYEESHDARDDAPL